MQYYLLYYINCLVLTYHHDTCPCMHGCMHASIQKSDIIQLHYGMSLGLQGIYLVLRLIMDERLKI